MATFPRQAHKEKLMEAIEQICCNLMLLSEMGCKGFDCSNQSLHIVSGWGKKVYNQVESLEKIRKDIGECDRCRLSKNRRNIVFGSGNPHASLMFVGEGPGYEEDIQGEPFVGAAGQLLTRIIKAIKLSREQVYICNVVKCRPPDNRTPTADEIMACLPFLQRQIRAIQPRFLCTLGTIATKSLLQIDEPISVLRGKFYDLGQIKVIPTYHPAYLLRNPERKRDVWEDMKKLMNAMGIDTGKNP